MARKFHERRSLRNALATYLAARQWNVEYREGYKPEDVIEIPTVSIYFLPNAFNELEMGRGDNKRNFVRRVQIDCYMEDENRADAITDDIMDFIDEENITVTEVGTGAELGYMFSDTESIITETIPPIFSEPKVTRWRGVIRATYEVFYD